MEVRKPGQVRPNGPPSTPSTPKSVPLAGGLRGQKAPYVHRLFLVDGRVIRGDLHRMPHTRLGDHLSTQKGFLSVTNAVCERTNERYQYIVVVMSSLLFLEEVDERGSGADLE